MSRVLRPDQEHDACQLKNPVIFELASLRPRRLLSGDNNWPRRTALQYEIIRFFERHGSCSW